MLSRVRVKMATPDSSRWTWIRIPSIFHSTAAGETRAKAAATLLADEASMGRSGRPTCRPNDRNAADAALPAGSGIAGPVVAGPGAAGAEVAGAGAAGAGMVGAGAAGSAEAAAGAASLAAVRAAVATACS